MEKRYTLDDVLKKHTCDSDDLEIFEVVHVFFQCKVCGFKDWLIAERHCKGEDED